MSSSYSCQGRQRDGDKNGKLKTYELWGKTHTTDSGLVAPVPPESEPTVVLLVPSTA